MDLVQKVFCGEPFHFFEKLDERGVEIRGLDFLLREWRHRRISEDIDSHHIGKVLRDGAAAQLTGNRVRHER